MNHSHLLRALSLPLPSVIIPANRTCANTKSSGSAFTASPLGAFYGPFRQKNRCPCESLGRIHQPSVFLFYLHWICLLHKAAHQRLVHCGNRCMLNWQTCMAMVAWPHHGGVGTIWGSPRLPSVCVGDPDWIWTSLPLGESILRTWVVFTELIILLPQLYSIFNILYCFKPPGCCGQLLVSFHLVFLSSLFLWGYRSMSETVG